MIFLISTGNGLKSKSVSVFGGTVVTFVMIVSLAGDPLKRIISECVDRTLKV